jgi:hypothetical protein
MAIAIVVLVIFLMQQCNSNSNLKQDSRISKQNELALTDSVRSVKNRWGEEIYLKNVFVANEKELKRLNAELAEDLKRAKGKVVYIQNTKTVIEHDTLFLKNTITQFSDGTTRLSWTHDTIYDAYNSRSLAGFSEFIMDSVGVTDKGTQITKDQIRIKLTTGLTELKGSYQIFVKSDYPGFTIDSLDGAIVDKKKFAGSSNESSFVFGPYLGVSAGYDPLNRSFGPTINVGVGVMFNLNKQIKRLIKK